MGYLEGFAVTLRQIGDTVTIPYPERKRPKADRLHGRHVLNRYEDGMEKCIGCELCAGVCPANCIYVRGADNDPDDPTSPGERFGFVYEINYLRCIHCDLCVEACPTEAITESKLFEFSFTDRRDAVYTKAELVVGDDGKPQQLPWEDWREGEDQFTSDHGWTLAELPRVAPLVRQARDLGVRVSLFVDPEPDAMAAVAAIGAHRVELYTEPYAAAWGTPRVEVELARYAATARAALAAGLGVNAGHDLSRDNLAAFLRAVPGVQEVSIGHALIADALELGYACTVREYLGCIRAAGGGA